MKRYYIGLDGGSTYLKAAMIDEQGNVVDTMVRNTGIDNSGTASALVDALCQRSRIARQQVGYIMATGYSRKVLDVADDDISEITAHAYGVRITAPPQWRPGMIVDVGGQDSKIIYLDANYTVKNFSMNDKCAAGTGKFMEVIAQILETTIDQVGPLVAAEHRALRHQLHLRGVRAVGGHLARGAQVRPTRHTRRHAPVHGAAHHQDDAEVREGRRRADERRGRAERRPSPGL